MGSPAAPSPYQEVKSSTQLAPKYEALLGFNKDSPAYSPFQALSRQAGAQAKMIEGMTTAPKWSSIYQALGVQPGTDLTPYLQAMRQGTSMPLASIPRSPEAGAIPEYTNPSDTGKVPKKEAARGGLMSLAKPRGYAEAGSVKALTPAQRQAVLKINKAIEAGTATDAQKAQLDKIEKNTGLNVSPFSETGTATPKNPAVAKSITSTADTYKKQQADVATGAGIPISQALNQEVPFYDPTGQAYNTAIALQQKKASGQTLTKDEEATLANSGAMLDPYGGVTNPVYRQALDQLRTTSQAPETIGEGAGIMSSAAGKLMDQAGSFSPQQINAKDLTGTASQMDAATMQGREAQAAAMQAASMQAAQANRGDIRDIKAIQADVDKYKAAGMQAPLALQAEAYQAAQMQGAQLQGPKSWTDEGMAQKYMNPYQQNVTDIAKRESMRDFGKQLAQLRSQATGQKAFGGTRAALQESEARRGQAQRMSDIEAQGLNEAYKSGMGQFSAEQGLGLQAGQSNLQAALTMQQQNQAATNAQRQMYVQQALDAAKTSYGGELTAAQQNQIAQNAAAQFNSQSQNTAYNNYVAQQLAASQANQGMDWNTVNLNTQNQQAAALANAQFQQQAAQLNAQNQQQAELANQQYGLGGFQSNLNNAQFNQQANQQNAQLLQQMALANQNVGLQSAIQNQQAGLTGQGLNLQALNQAGQMGQGLGALGNTTWGNQQNVAQLWGAAGQTVQNAAQNAANAKQQTGMNWWGGMGNAYNPSTQLILGAAGQQGTQTTNRIPGT
jgi:hypothetical protein